MAKIRKRLCEIIFEADTSAEKNDEMPAGITFLASR